MRTKHYIHTLDRFPVFSAAFISQNELVVGGGGGDSKTGIKNKVKLFTVSDDAQQLTQVDELELNQGDDTPMSMAAHLPTRSVVAGINSSAAATQGGVNQNCRQIVFNDKGVHVQTTRSTIKDPSAYQRVTAFSLDGAFLLTASTSNEISVLNFPSLSPACSAISIPPTDGELFDVTMNETHIVATTTTQLLVYSWVSRSSSPTVETSGTKSKKSGKRKSGKAASSSTSSNLQVDLVKKLGIPSWAGAGASFRAGRFSPTKPTNLLAIVNVSTPKGRKYTRKGFAVRFIIGDDSSKWQNEAAKRTLGDRSVSSFDVCPSGKFLAYGSSDLSIGILDATTFAPLITILRAHDFPSTTVRFNPTSSLLVSGSADNSCRLVAIPESVGAQNTGSWLFLLVALLVLLVAIAGTMLFS